MISYYKIDKLKKISKWNIEVEKYLYHTRVFIYTNIPVNDSNGTTLNFSFILNYDFFNKESPIFKIESHFCKPETDSLQMLYINGKKKHINAVIKIDFDNWSAEDIYEGIKEWCNKQVAKINLSVKKYKTALAKNNIENEDFIYKMKKLAEEHETFFNVEDINKWLFANVIHIDLFKAEKVWRVRVDTLNYTYFKCINLEEVYNLCKWFMEIPSAPYYKF